MAKLSEGTTVYYYDSWDYLFVLTAWILVMGPDIYDHGAIDRGSTPLDETLKYWMEKIGGFMTFYSIRACCYYNKSVGKGIFIGFLRYCFAPLILLFFKIGYLTDGAGFYQRQGWEPAKKLWKLMASDFCRLRDFVLQSDTGPQRPNR